MSVSRFGLKNIGLVYSVFSPSVYKTKQSADRFENQSTVRCEIFWSEVFSLQRFFTFFCFFFRPKSRSWKKNLKPRGMLDQRYVVVLSF